MSPVRKFTFAWKEVKDIPALQARVAVLDEHLQEATYFEPCSSAWAFAASSA